MGQVSLGLASCQFEGHGARYCQGTLLWLICP
jgi:hypothetical protein